MERLTERELSVVGIASYTKCNTDACVGYCGGCNAEEEIALKLKRYEDLEEQCHKNNHFSLRHLLHKWEEFLEDVPDLMEYRKLEEQGLLLKLPCKVGDKVYAFDYPRTDIVVVQEEVVEKILVWVGGIEIETNDGFYFFEHFGETVFLTREEAEAKLKEMSGEP